VSARTTQPEGPHFVGQTLHLVTRLRDHIERLDRGAAYAADDLAVVLRAFLCRGYGNDVLRRLQRLAGAQARPILLSRVPELDARFAVGSIPTRDHAERDGATSVPVDRWPERPVLHVRDKFGATTYTWSQFLNTYANKWGGAHLDRAVPVHLQVIDMFATGSLNLSGYLLRAAAVTVWCAAQEVLGKIIRTPASGHLTAEQLAESVLSAPGGVHSPPLDRLVHGELQWLTYKGEMTGFLLYADGPCRLRISIGGAHTRELELYPQDTVRPPPPLTEVRSPNPPEPTADDFSLGRLMRVTGSVVPPPQATKA